MNILDAIQDFIDEYPPLIVGVMAILVIVGILWILGKFVIPIITDILPDWVFNPFVMIAIIVGLFVAHKFGKFLKNE